MRVSVKQNSKAIGVGLLCLVVGWFLASFATYPVRQGIYNAPAEVTAWFRHHGFAAIAVEWVPAFLHGLVGGVAGMLGGLRVAKGASALVLAATLAVAVVATAAYALISDGDAIGLFGRGKIYLETLGSIGGLASVLAVQIARAHHH